MVSAENFRDQPSRRGGIFEIRKCHRLLEAQTGPGLHPQLSGKLIGKIERMLVRGLGFQRILGDRVQVAVAKAFQGVHEPFRDQGAFDLVRVRLMQFNQLSAVGRTRPGRRQTCLEPLDHCQTMSGMTQRQCRCNIRGAVELPELDRLFKALASISQSPLIHGIPRPLVLDHRCQGVTPREFLFRNDLSPFESMFGRRPRRQPGMSRGFPDQAVHEEQRRAIGRGVSLLPRACRYIPAAFAYELVS